MKDRDLGFRAGVVAVVAALAALLFVPSLVGCRSAAPSPPPRYVLGSTLGGYEIQAVLDRPAELVRGEDHVVIGIGRHRLRVEAGRVVLDDNETAAFPASAAQVLVEVLDGTLRVAADGEEVWSRPFAW